MIIMITITTLMIDIIATFLPLRLKEVLLKWWRASQSSKVPPHPLMPCAIIIKALFAFYLVFAVFSFEVFLVSAANIWDFWHMHVTISCYKTHPRLLRQYHSLCIALYCRVAGELPVLRSTISAQHFEPKAALGIAVSHNLPTLLQQFTDVTRFKVLEKVKHTRGWGLKHHLGLGEARIPPPRPAHDH